MASVPIPYARTPLTGQQYGTDNPSLNRAFDSGIGREMQILGGHFAKLHVLADAEQAKADDLEASRAWADLHVQLAETEIRLRDTATYRDYGEQWEKNTQELHKQFNQRLEGLHRDVGQSYAKKWQGLFATGKIRATEQQARLAVEHQRAEGVTALDAIAESAAQERDPEERYQLLRDGYARINSMEGGALNELEALDLRRRFETSVKTKRLEYLGTKLQNQMDDLVNKAFRDPINARLYSQEGSRILDQASDSLNPGELAQQKRLHTNAVWFAALKTRTQADPVGTLDELRAGKYDEQLDQKSLEHLIGLSETEIEKRRRQQEAERKDNERQIGKMVSDYKEARMSGFDWAGNEAQLGRLVQGTEHEADFRNIQQASRDLGRFNQLTPREQEEYLRITSQQPKSGDAAKFFGTLQAAHEKTKAGLAKDPLTFAIRQRVIPDPGPLNLSNPASLKARSLVAGIAEQRYGVPVSPLTDDESSAVLNAMKEMTPAGRVVVMQGLTQAWTPRQVQMFASQMDQKGAGEMAQAMGMSGQVPEAARRIVEGMEIKKTNPATLPKNMAAMDTAINTQLAPAYAASPEALESVRNAIKSAYAWSSWQMGELNAESHVGKRLENAIHTVTGGVINFNGSAVLAPRYSDARKGESEREREFRSMIERADFSRVMGTITAKDVLNYGKLTSVGPGLYAVRMAGAPVFDKSGSPFILDLGNIEAGPTLPQKPSAYSTHSYSALEAETIPVY